LFAIRSLNRVPALIRNPITGLANEAKSNAPITSNEKIIFSWWGKARKKRRSFSIAVDLGSIPHSMEARMMSQSLNKNHVKEKGTKGAKVFSLATLARLGAATVRNPDYATGKGNKD